MAQKATAAKTSNSKGTIVTTVKKTALSSPQGPVSSQSQVLQLQQQYGNESVQRMYRSGLLQAKIKVGKAGDKYEQEADSVADRVMSMPGPQVVRQEEDKEEVKAKPLSETITPLLQRQEEEEEAQPKLLQRQEEEEEAQPKLLQRQEEEEEAQPKLLQRQEEEEEVQPKLLQRQEKEEEVQPKLLQLEGGEGAASVLSNDKEISLRSIRGGGHTLPDGTRTFMESRFGTDFSSVRVHTGGQANGLASSINAKAFTLNNDIVFKEGHYSPDTYEGKRLLAHELTHVVQQNPSLSKKPLHNRVMKNSDLSYVQKKEERAVSEEERKAALKKAAAAEVDAGSAKKKGHGEVVQSQNRASQKKKEKSTTEKVKKAVSAEARSIEKLAGEKMKKVEKKKAGEDKGGKGKKAKGKALKKGVAKKKTGIPKRKGDKAPASLKEDPAYLAVIGEAKKTGSQQKAHKPAADESKAAQNAAVSPPSELAGKAQDSQVEKMEKAETPAFNAAAFKKKLMERIAAMAPSTTEEADNLDASSIKDEVKGSVSDEKKASTGAIENTATEAPDVKAAKPKPVTPLAPANPGKTPAAIGAQNAVPKEKGKSEIEGPLKEKSEGLDKQMAAGGVTEEQLAKSNEPSFKAALDNKKSAQADAKSAPAKYRKFEKGTIASAKKEAVVTAKKSLAQMHGDRSALLQQVSQQQTKTKTKDELAREKVGTDIQAIYKATKKEVETTLDQLDKDVEAAFDSGANAARYTFENYVASKMRAYKEDRYGGWFGWARWAKDKIFSMPSEVNVFYTKGRKLYIDKMDAVIDNVVAIIGAGLTKAKQQVVNGKKKIKEYVEGLPANLQKVGQEAATDIQDRFDELEGSIDSKQDQLIDSLAGKYNENLKAVDARIEEMKEANKGLVEKAVDAVEGAIEAISNLKDMLFNILAKAVSVISTIISDPIGFLGNMVKGIKMGFDNFVANIWKHLKAGLIGWLTGALGPVGITLPEDLFSLKGIFSLVMQILGLTWDYIRSKAVKLFGEKAVSVLESTFEPFMILIKEGPAGLWAFVKEKFSDLKEMVIEKIKDMIITQVITAGVKWIIGLLNPAGAFIKAAMAIYEIVKFFIERGKQILELVNSIVDAVIAIAKGSLSGAAKMVEDALARAIPVVIGFLASLLGISGLAKKVQDIIKNLRKRVDRVVDGVLMKAKKVLGPLVAKGKAVVKGGLAKGKAAVNKVFQWWKAKKAFKNKDNEKHTIFFKGSAKNARLKIASAEKTYDQFLNEVTISESDPEKAKKKPALASAKTIYGKIVTLKTKQGSNTADKGEKTPDFQGLIDQLAAQTAIFMSGSSSAPESVPPVYGSLTGGGFGTSMDISILSSKGPKGTPASASAGDTYKTLLTRVGPSGRKPFYNQGHLLSESLHGPGTVWRNLTPLSASGNKLHSANFEDKIITFVNKGGVCKYSVQAVYGRAINTSLKAAIRKQYSETPSAEEQKELNAKFALVDAEKFVPKKLTCSATKLAESSPAAGDVPPPLGVDNDIKEQPDEYRIAGFAPVVKTTKHAKVEELKPGSTVAITKMNISDLVNKLEISERSARNIQHALRNFPEEPLAKALEKHIGKDKADYIMKTLIPDTIRKFAAKGITVTI